MKPREELQALLEELLGSENVYYQPPESIKMRYPCIVYEKSDETNRFADDAHYMRFRRYDITVMTKDPDSDLPDKIADLDTAVFERCFKSDNIYHNIYRIYF